MFDHEKFDNYPYEQIPLERDIFLIGKMWMQPYEEMMLRFFGGSEYQNVGFISWASVRAIYPDSIALSWYVNHWDRFHEIAVTLPRSEFIACVGCWQCDERPMIFVSDSWLDHLHLRNYSVFGLIDAIGIKRRLDAGSMNPDSLNTLRGHIDNLAARHPEISLISFGDSLLLKSNWTVGMFNSDGSYTYSPEEMLFLFGEVAELYLRVLDTGVYGIFTQGTNDLYGSALLHRSAAGNHVCLNCLGHAFARLFAIDEEARKMIRESVHSPSELYLDEDYFRSLQLSGDFRGSIEKGGILYDTKLNALPRRYYRADLCGLKENIQITRTRNERQRRRNAGTTT